jgi:hypothetical protein
MLDSGNQKESPGLSPFIPMFVAFFGIGGALLYSIQFAPDQFSILVLLGSGLFLLILSFLCAFLARKRGEFNGIGRRLRR